MHEWTGACEDKKKLPQNTLRQFLFLRLCNGNE